jgi:integrase
MIVEQREPRPTTATWLYQISSAFLHHAEACGWAAPLLPRKGLTLIAPKAAARQRVLDDDELRRVWVASAKLGAKSRCFVRLLILTPCRVAEAAGIAMGELDLDAERWTIPAARAKNKRRITLPLHRLLRPEFAAVMPELIPHADCRLLGLVRGSAFSGISGIKEFLDRESGVTGWRMHDFRRTARTGMTRLGLPTAHAEAALNHVSHRSVLERTYDVHDYGAEIIAAVKRWQAHVAALVEQEPQAAVVERAAAA